MLRPEDRESGRRGHAGRWALLVLLAIVALIWLASETLLPADADEAEIAYSEVKRLVVEAPETIERLEFRPDDRTIEVRFTDGTSAESAYPSETSAAQLERTLDEQGVEYTAEPGGNGTWWSFAVYLVPFALFFGFWIFLMRRVERFGSRRGNGSEPWRPDE